MALFKKKNIPPQRFETRAEEETQATADSVLLHALLGNDAISEQLALEIPAFSAAVDFIANTVAMLPIKLYKENAGTNSTEEITDDYRLPLLNDETGDLMNAYSAKSAQLRDMLIGGAGYMFISRSGSHINSLHYVKRGSVCVTMNADPIFKTANISVNGKNYFPFNFVILTRSSTDGVTGVGIIKEHSTILSAMYNALKYENTASKTGGNKKGFLQSEHRLTKPAIDELKAAWNDMYANNDSTMMVLNDGVKFQQSSNTSVEMQLNQNKMTNSAQIASIFGLSVDVISGRASNEVYMSSVRTAVMPIVSAYQEALNHSLLLESEKADMYFALDTTELMRGDMLSRYNAYAVGLANNFLQVDEVRYKEDLKPLGINYVKLGLNDVLLDPKTNTVYTPNTNQTTVLGAQKAGLNSSPEVLNG